MPRNPRFPLYIPSKGRSDSMLTSRALDAMGVPHRLIVEEQEYAAYLAAVDGDRTKLLVLDKAYQRDYETCDDLGDTKSKGPGPARNFAWAHARSEGHAWHWVMDDNIKDFKRLNHDRRIKVTNGAPFVAMEDFCLRYRNVGMAGPNYSMFAFGSQALPPFVLNTRIYSCNLIRNDLPFRWRGRYNEDTILSLDLLKAGWCTIQFNAFLQGKVRTQTLSGGNTAEFYAKEGTLAKSQMLVRVHPDVAELVWKFGRWHHSINYRQHFHHLGLLRKDDAPAAAGALAAPTAPNEYGMRLVALRAPRAGTRAPFPTR